MKWLKSILFAFIFFNPIVLLILFKSYWIAILVPLLIIVGGYYASKIKTFRITVWLFNIFAIIGIALNAELVFRSLYSNKNVPNIYEARGKYYFNKPFLNQKFDDEEFNSRYVTNCQGYRIDLLSNPEDSLKRCDWLFIGDSFTQGAQVNYDEMFSSIIYRDFPDKTIVNAGMSGAGLYESLNYLKDEGKKLKPKRVILQIGTFNDFYNIKERHAGWSEYLTEHSGLYRLLQYQILDNPILPLGRWTEPFFDNPEENAKFNIFYKQTSDQKTADIKAFEEVLGKFKKETDAIGAELVVVLIPSKEQVSDEMLNEVTSKFNIEPKELDMQAPNKLTQRVCGNLGIRLLDLYDSFRNADKFPFFLRDEHLSIDGHKLIASELKQSFGNEANKYNVFSLDNRNERYPTFYDDGMSVLFQRQEPGLYKIVSSNLIRSREDEVWSSPKELIHPMISPDNKWLVFTQGDQDRGETDVILYNFETRKDIKINPSGFRGAIPTFSHGSKMLVYPKLHDNENPVIAIYDIESDKEIASFGNKSNEVWRPVFSPDDRSVYFIKMNNVDLFEIHRYDLESKKTFPVLKTDYNIWNITISPLGRSICFAGNKDGNWDLFLYDLTSRQVRQLTHSIGNEWDPVFYSEDEIWFAGEFGINNGIYHINIAQ